MKIKEEIEKEIKIIENELELHTPKNKQCPSCGQSMPFQSTWMIYDYWSREGKIEALKWVLKK